MLGLTAVLLAALVTLGVAFGLQVAERDWAEAARVDDVVINRAQLRDRVALVEFLAEARERAIRSDLAARTLDAASAETMLRPVNESRSDPVTAALDQLVNEVLVEREAHARGLAEPGPDIAEELARSVGGGPSYRLAWLAIRAERVAPAKSATSSPATGPATSTAVPTTDALAAGRYARERIAGDERVGPIVEALQRAGWRVEGGETTLPSDGPWLELHASLLAAARSSAPGDIVGPYQDPEGRVSVARVLAVEPDATSGADLAADAREEDIPEGTLRDWADGMAMKRGLRENLLRQWRSEPLEQVRAQILVVGPVDNPGDEGPWVQLSHVLVDRLEGVASIPGRAGGAPLPSGLTFAQELANRLRQLPRGEREQRFQELVDVANRSTGSDASTRSGELGFFTPDQLIEPLSKTAFTEETTSGTVLGPFQTSAGEELFLVEARYDGPLDERSAGVLTEARSRHGDLGDLARRLAPNHLYAAVSPEWRARPEFEGHAAAAVELFETPLNTLSDPFALGDQLVLARPVQRRLASAEPAQLDRLALTGFQRWLDGLRARTAVRLADDPLPEAPTSAWTDAEGTLPPLP